ncbi:MAG: hypothetical protein KIT73_13050 [Burkholderiales bacterium]|nr:hypothetical protein [Burkholderiales bacterium]
MTPKLQPFVAGPSGGPWLPLPAADDVFCCLGDERSYHRRDQAYRAVLESDVTPIAHSAAAGGCRRFVLVAPMAAFLQLAGTGRGFTSTAEATTAALGFETIVFVRPTENDRKREGTWLQRAAAAWIGTLAHYLTPQQLQPVTSKTVAAAVVGAPWKLGPGIHVIGAENLQAAAAM